MSSATLCSTFIIQNALLASKLWRKAGNHLSIHGISLTEYLVMQYLNDAPQKAVARIELAEHMAMSASGITRLIAPLEKIKLVEKEANPRDARQSLVKLSKTGQRVYQEASVSFEHIASDMLGHLSEAQLAKMLEVYGKLGRQV